MNAVHFRSTTPEWLTPPAVIERVVCCLGAIDLDPCSNAHEAPNVPAARHYTQRDDGLRQPWRGRVFRSPPYGREVSRWVQKLCQEYEAGRVTAAVALLPARTDTAWFRLLGAYPVCFLAGRLKFSDSPKSAPFPSTLVYLGNEPDAFTRAAGDLGDLRGPVVHGGDA